MFLEWAKVVVNARDSWIQMIKIVATYLNKSNVVTGSSGKKGQTICTITIFC